MKTNPANERIKHEYFSYLKQARQLNEHSVAAVAKALDRFETYTKRKDFKRFHREQAIAFKTHLAEQLNARTGERLSKATMHSTLAALKAFFFWLAGQQGYKSKLQYDDAHYFNMSLKDTAIAKAVREPRVPTISQIKSVLGAMPSGTAIEKRNRAVVAFSLLTGARDSATASMRLKHVDIAERQIFQDARDVRTKFSKSFGTFFFPVGDDVEAIFVSWVAFLRDEQGFGNDDPLFPATRMVPGADGNFAPVGLARECWSTASPIRAIFKDAFEAAGLPYFNPHSFRKTLVRLGMDTCTNAEAFKAWSQNLGHEEVLTTFNSYGTIPAHRQGELIRMAVLGDADDRRALEVGRAALAAARAAKSV
jgi:integrase